MSKVNSKEEKTVENKMNSEKYWDSIKDLPIDVFAMQKKVSDYFKFQPFDPEKCYLISSASAALPALEQVVNGKFECNLVEKYVVLTPVKRGF